MKTIRVLLAEGDSAIRVFLTEELKKAGFNITLANSGKEVIDIIQKRLPDVILMDIVIPAIDGIEVCRIIRKEKKITHIPIIFLSSHAEEYSELAAFEMGANDYIVKPIKPRVLIARINALISRREIITNKITFKDLIIDKEEYTVFLNNKKISFRKREFELLCFFCENPHKIFTRDDLINIFWKNMKVIPRTIDSHISRIRKKIGEDYIYSIKGVGYRLANDQ